jgi:hypothetical protein
MKYVPIFDGILDSTLWDEPLEVRLLYFTMLMLMDGDFVVRLDFEKIARKARLRVNRKENFAEARKALEILMEPDKYMVAEQVKDGRRVVELESGAYLVVNGQKYQDLMFEVNSARRRKRAQQERRRLDKLKAMNSGTPMTGEALALAVDAAGHPDAAEAIAAETKSDHRKSWDAAFEAEATAQEALKKKNPGPDFPPMLPQEKEPAWMTMAKNEEQQARVIRAGDAKNEVEDEDVPF